MTAIIAIIAFLTGVTVAIISVALCEDDDLYSEEDNDE